MASKRWRRWVRDLCETFPAPDGRKISVRRAALSGYTLGETRDTKNGWVIVVDRRLPELLAWFVLIHEAAHVQAWHEPVDHSDCGKSSCTHWGCWHARIWRDNHHDGDHWDE